MAREGYSHGHEGPSYKVHDHPHTSIYIDVHISCTMLSHRAEKSTDIANVPRV